MYETFGLFTGDSRIRGGNSPEAFSPVSERSPGAVCIAAPEDARSAIDAAADALAPLPAPGGFGRADALHRVAEEMARRADEATRTISAETGKPLVQSGRGRGLACDQSRRHAEEARRIHGRTAGSRVPGGRFEIRREPVGIAGAFTAWNFPAALPARKSAPALAAGCPVILRQSSQPPGAAIIPAGCLRAGDLPDGAAILVIGVAGDACVPIMADPRVRKLSRTGSTGAGGQMIRDAAETVKKASMELGGNAPLIVLDDAGLDMALEASVPAKHANCGQACVVPDRFFVHESLRDHFVEGFLERAGKIKLGHGLDPETGMGPLIESGRPESVDGMVRPAVADCATLALEGKRAAEFNEGHFCEPTVLTGVTDEMTAFADEEEALRRANSPTMGLSAYAFTPSPDRARRAAGALRSGMAGVNSFALAAAEALLAAQAARAWAVRAAGRGSTTASSSEVRG